MTNGNNARPHGGKLVFLVSTILGIGIILDGSGCLALVGLGAVIGFVIGIACVSAIHANPRATAHKQNLEREAL